MPQNANNLLYQLFTGEVWSDLILIRAWKYHGITFFLPSLSTDKAQIQKSETWNNQYLGKTTVFLCLTYSKKMTTSPAN